MYVRLTKINVCQAGRHVGGMRIHIYLQSNPRACLAVDGFHNQQLPGMKSNLATKLLNVALKGNE